MQFSKDTILIEYEGHGVGLVRQPKNMLNIIIGIKSMWGLALAEIIKVSIYLNYFS